MSGACNRPPRSAGQHRQSIGHGLRTNGCAFERINGDVDGRSLACADLLADIQHWRFIHLALADNDEAVDIDAAKLLAHGVSRRFVRGLYIAPATQLCCCNGRAFRYTTDFQYERAPQHVGFLLTPARALQLRFSALFISFVLF